MDNNTVALMARVYGEQSARKTFDSMTTPSDNGVIALTESALAQLLEIAFLRGYTEGRS